jgi:FMN reductase
VVGSGVYVESSHFDKYKLSDEKIKKRLETLGKATAELSLAVEKSQFLSELGPQF